MRPDEAAEAIDPPPPTAKDEAAEATDPPPPTAKEEAAEATEAPPPTAREEAAEATEPPPPTAKLLAAETMEAPPPTMALVAAPTTLPPPPTIADVAAPAIDSRTEGMSAEFKAFQALRSGNLVGTVACRLVVRLCEGKSVLQRPPSTHHLVWAQDLVWLGQQSGRLARQWRNRP